MGDAGDITRLLRMADGGDAAAVGRLFALVQDDLKAIARRRKRLSPSAADASTTVLVDEAFLRLVGQQATEWAPGDRRKFFGFASNQMHDLLLKGARAARAAKRGGGRARADQEPDEIAQRGDAADIDLLIDLKEALERFERFAVQDALIFRLRYFLASTFEEAAQIADVSVTQAKRCYERARLWLENELKDYALDA